MANIYHAPRRIIALFVALAVSLVLAIPMAVANASPVYQATTAQDGSGERVFANGSFEESAPGQVAADWTPFNSVSETGFTVIDGDGVTGDQAVLMVDNSPTDQIGLRSTPLPVEPGKKYEIGAWGKVEEGSPSLIVYFYNENNVQVANPSVRIRQATGTWVWHSISAIAPQDAASVSIMLYSAPDAITRVVWDDAMVFDSGTTGVNFPNPGFEVDEIDGRPSQWKPRMNTTVDSFVVVDEPTRSGSRAVRMIDSSDVLEVGLESGAAQVTGGVQYEVGVWAKIEQGIPSWVLYFDDANGNNIGQVSHRITVSSGEWSWESQLVTAPEGAASARLLLFSSSGDVTHVYWDDAAIFESAGWAEESLGHPLYQAAILDTSFGIGADGRAKIYSVSTGLPATFQIIDAETGERDFSQAMVGGSHNAWTVITASDGSVYAGTTTNGALYRWSPETQEVINLGRATSTSSYVWDLIEDDDGLIWGGVFPKGEVFSYDPQSNQFTNHGAWSSEEYVRSITAHDGWIYAGFGSDDPKIVAYNPETSEQFDIRLPDEYNGPDSEFVYTLDTRGDLLFTRHAPSSHLLVYDLVEQRWIDNLGHVAFGVVSEISDDGNVYYVDISRELVSYNIADGTRGSTGLGDLEPARDFGWVEFDDPDYPGQTLVFMFPDSTIVRFNPQTGNHSMTSADAVSAPVRLQTIGNGPDGKIYITGYMHNSLASYDPDTQETYAFPYGYVGQGEGLIAHRGELYLGTYTRANLYRYNPNTEWGTPGSPKRLDSLGRIGQDRPFAWTTVGDQVATGTVPTYGQLGGALAVYDPDADSIEVFENLIDDHSILSLASDGEIIFGGTSIFGGLGAIPTSKSARIFAFDPSTGQLLWNREMGSNIQSVTAIETGPDGKLWVIDLNMLYEIDPATGETLRSAQLVPHVWAGVSTWAGADIEFNEEGEMFALSRGIIFQIDHETLDIRKLATGASGYQIAIDRGNIYFLRSDALVRLVNPGITLPLEYHPAAQQTFQVGADSDVNLGFAQGSTLSASSIEVTVDWGDGSSSTLDGLQETDSRVQLRAQHTYATPGEYVASVTVSDGSDEVTDTVNLFIQAEAIVYDPALVVPGSVKAGETLSVTGQGFAAGELVEVSVLGESGVALSIEVEADAAGLLGADLDIPAALTPGLYMVRALGATSDTPAEAEFEVLEAADSGDPGDGEPGDGEPGDGEPGDGEPGDGEPGDGEPGDGVPGDGSGALPQTGMDVAVGVILVALLLAAGVVAFASRRRTSND